MPRAILLAMPPKRTRREGVILETERRSRFTSFFFFFLERDRSFLLLGGAFDLFLSSFTDEGTGCLSSSSSFFVTPLSKSPEP